MPGVFTAVAPSPVAVPHAACAQQSGGHRGCDAVIADAYRDTVRAMTAIDHFGTDYLPLDSDTGESVCLCDVEPGTFAVFAFAVLALHHVRRSSFSTVPVCSCGQSVTTCPVQSLARGLLFAPHPTTVREVQP